MLVSVAEDQAWKLVGTSLVVVLSVLLLCIAILCIHLVQAPLRGIAAAVSTELLLGDVFLAVFYTHSWTECIVLVVSAICYSVPTMLLALMSHLGKPFKTWVALIIISGGCGVLARITFTILVLRRWRRYRNRPNWARRLLRVLERNTEDLLEALADNVQTGGILHSLRTSLEQGLRSEHGSRELSVRCSPVGFWRTSELIEILLMLVCRHRHNLMRKHTKIAQRSSRIHSCQVQIL